MLQSRDVIFTNIAKSHLATKPLSLDTKAKIFELKALQCLIHVSREN